MAREDFEASWDALVARALVDDRFGGGNFMFGLLAVVYLELTCRTAAADASGMFLDHFSSRLAEIEPRYFGALPGPVDSPASVSLPQRPGAPADQHLLALIFDLVRNGQAHLYQQICVSLATPSGAKRSEDLLTIALGGVTGRPVLNETRRALEPPAEHLRLERTPKGHLKLTVLPDVLFVHIDQAARRSSLFSQGLVPNYARRKRRKASKGRLLYDFTSADLEAALKS